MESQLAESSQAATSASTNSWRRKSCRCTFLYPSRYGMMAVTHACVFMCRCFALKAGNITVFWTEFLPKLPICVGFLFFWFEGGGVSKPLGECPMFRLSHNPPSLAAFWRWPKAERLFISNVNINFYILCCLLHISELPKNRIGFVRPAKTRYVFEISDSWKCVQVFLCFNLVGLVHRYGACFIRTAVSTCILYFVIFHVMQTPTMFNKTIQL